MKALVVYDSFFGNTEQIARAVAGVIDGGALRVGEADPEKLDSVDLLIIGSPTRGFRASDATRAFIAGIPDKGLEGMRVAAFDTRIRLEDVGRGLRLLMKMGGYAAPRIAKALEKKGGKLVVPTEGFYVKDKEGPLAEGELERAAGWAEGAAKQRSGGLGSAAQ